MAIACLSNKGLEAYSWKTQILVTLTVGWHWWAIMETNGPSKASTFVRATSTLATHLTSENRETTELGNASKNGLSLTMSSALAKSLLCHILSLALGSDSGATGQTKVPTFGRELDLTPCLKDPKTNLQLDRTALTEK